MGVVGQVHIVGVREGDTWSRRGVLSSEMTEMVARLFATFSVDRRHLKMATRAYAAVQVQVGCAALRLGPAPRDSAPLIDPPKKSSNHHQPETA